VYSLCFDLSKLGDAHASCRAAFNDALRQKVGLILVDNTNTKLEEYSFYKRTASRAGYAVAVIELHCPEVPGVLEQLHARNVHGVPLKVLRTMQARFEADPVSSVAHVRACNLAPLAEGVSSGAPLPSLQQWLSAHHAVHYSKSRPKTHLVMAHGGQSAAFVFVPPTLREEFHSVYCAEQGPRYLCEVLDTSRMRLFFDVDVCHAPPLEGPWLLWLCRSLYLVLQAAGYGRQRVLATSADVTHAGGGKATKGGCHLHVPTVVIDASEAVALRSLLVEALVASPYRGGSAVEARVDWMDAIDAAVYRGGGGGGLRMVGSLKVKNGALVGSGRQYRLAMVVEKNGSTAPEARLAMYAGDGPRLLADCSIRADAD